VGNVQSVSLSGLDGSTTYYWQVRAVLMGGYTYANSTTWRSFTTMASAPGAFGKSSPADGASDVAVNPTLSWTASSGATSYEYCLDTTSGTTCDGIWTDVGNVLSVGLSGLDGSTTYYWQVRSVSAGGYTDADSGTWRSFTTVASGPGAFSKSAPADDVGGRSTSQVLSWEASGGAASYEYCIDTTDDSTCDGDWISTGTTRSSHLLASSAEWCTTGRCEL
jgi:hypothetical protein